MSILDTLKPKASAKPPSAAQIEQQLPAQRERVLELEAAISQAALDALTGDQEAVEHHRKVKVDLLAAHDKLALLNAAHAGAVAREKATLEANRAKVAESQRLAALGHCRSLAKDSEALAAALATAVELYQKALEHTAHVRRATPVGAKIPDDCLAPGRVRQLVLAELFRLSAPAAGPSIGRDSIKVFPGASSPDVMLDDNPGAIAPLVDQVRAEIENFKTAIGKKAE